MGTNFEELKALFNECTARVFLPALLNVNEVSYFMAKTVAEAFFANFPIVAYSYAHSE